MEQGPALGYIPLGAILEVESTRKSPGTVKLVLCKPSFTKRF